MKKNTIKNIEIKSAKQAEIEASKSKKSIPMTQSTPLTTAQTDERMEQFIKNAHKELLKRPNTKLMEVKTPEFIAVLESYKHLREAAQYARANLDAIESGRHAGTWSILDQVLVESNKVIGEL